MQEESRTHQVCSLPKTFVDGFAGAGGLSLGLMKAGWRGLFGIEKHPFAFETLRQNLIEVDRPPRYNWPSWLPGEPHDMASFVTGYKSQLLALKQKVTLVVGGPPCQGVSMAGLRDENDERNRLFEKYLELVDLLSPPMVLLENVQGITVPFGDNGNTHTASGEDSVADEIMAALTRMGYQVFSGEVRAADYGVPQIRTRYIITAVRREITDGVNKFRTPLEVLEGLRTSFLTRKQLPVDTPICLRDAISDLEKRHGTIQSEEFPHFREGLYGPATSQYHKLMRVNRDGTPLPADVRPDSHRFVNHRDITVAKFEQIMRCRRGVALSVADRKRLGIGKHGVVPLAAAKPCHTLTSLPDDLIHYSEPRVFTVREYARVQSFEDWFVFRGNYTTGGKQRKHDVPRYTQVANAVPPFLAEAIGLALASFMEQFPGYSLE